jgi:hypothetical protein
MHRALKLPILQSYFEYGVYLEEVRKDFTSAIEMYRHAVDTGGNSLGVLMRCGELMCRCVRSELPQFHRFVNLWRAQEANQLVLSFI